MELRERNVRPHVAENSSGPALGVDMRTTRHPGYATSQRIRKRIEEAFGWIKTVAGLRKTRSAVWPRRPALHLRSRRLQSGADTQAVGRSLPGRRRWTAGSSAAGGSSGPTSGIAATSISSPPPPLTIGADGHGEIAYGAMQASLELEKKKKKKKKKKNI